MAAIQNPSRPKEQKKKGRAASVKGRAAVARKTKASRAKSKTLPLTVTEKSETKLRLRRDLGLTRPLFARLLNVSERTIAGAERGERLSAKLARTYRETERLYKALCELVAKGSIGPWLLEENERFDGLKPLELIERGKIDLLWDMVHRLRYGMSG